MGNLLDDCFGGYFQKVNSCFLLDGSGAYCLTKIYNPLSEDEIERYAAYFQIKLSASYRKNVDRINARVAAKLLLSGYGHKKFTILNEMNGSPIWPLGMNGSISHCYPYAAVIITASKDLSLGIDIESLGNNFGSGELDVVLSSKEQLLLKDVCGLLDSYLNLALIVFSAKESIYKALHKYVNRFIDFMEVQVVDVNLNNQSMEFNVLLEDLPGSNSVIVVSWKEHEQYCMTYCGYNLISESPRDNLSLGDSGAASSF